MREMTPIAMTVSKRGAIIPRRAAPLRTLLVVMAVMCFLAVMAVGGMILIERAVSSWAQGLASEMTVQVRDVSNRDVEADVASAVEILKGHAGLDVVEALPRQASEKLLEPWIGSEGLDKLPVPRLIRVTVDEKSPPDLVALEAKLLKAVPVARLDTHRQWEAELQRMAGTLTLLSLLILALIATSAIAMVVFATKSVLYANKDIVEVLHFSGAEDGFIARAIDRRFLATGLWAGLLGLLFGLGTFAAVGYFGDPQTNGVALAARGLFHVPAEGDHWKLGWFLAVPVAATLIALLTSRLTLMRMLRALS